MARLSLVVLLVAVVAMAMGDDLRIKTAQWADLVQTMIQDEMGGNDLDTDRESLPSMKEEEDFNVQLPPSDMQLQEEPSFLYGDVLVTDPMLRDSEKLPYLPLFGHQFLSGGAGEGSQSLGPAGLFANMHEVKTDGILPAYCEPPNPCPKGYTSDDGCLESVPNTAEFSRDFQAQQQCQCDADHMFSCGQQGNMISVNQAKMHMADDHHQGLVAKKWKIEGSNSMESYKRSRVPRSIPDHNPHLQGEKVIRVAKKGLQMHHRP